MAAIEFDIEAGGSKISDVTKVGAGGLTNTPLVRLVKRTHLAHTDSQAQNILIAVSVIFFMAAIFITLYFVFDVGRQKETRFIGPESGRLPSQNSQNRK